MKLKIITVPNPLLRQKSKKISKITPEIKRLSQDMLNFIKGDQEGESIGVGLSAVQIGQPIQLIVAYSKKTSHYFTVINPKIIWRSKEKTRGVPEARSKYEGCLSVPGYFGVVKRPESIVLRYQTISGRTLQKKFSGFIATVFQHEIDHLNGIIFTDRVLKQKGKLFKAIKDEKGNHILAEVQLS